MAFLTRFAVLLLGCVAAGVNGMQEPGLQFEKRAGSMPVLKLDYGSFMATDYNTDADIYTFKNVRFGQPPLGNLRWAKPVRPKYNATVSDGSYGPYCVQAQPRGLNLLGNLDELGTLAGDINGLVTGVVPLLSGGQEDCLFLDLYVPGKAIRSPSTTSLPVTVWTYGGAYVFGAKDEFEPLLPLYSGVGPVQNAKNDMIFVSYNYRVGAFGYLAGTTMEQQGQPNVGFYDQRAVYQWVQDYIGLVGGNKAQVTAWGESAGAGSIFHHITAFGGKQDPLFNKVVLQSTVTQSFVDRRGMVEDLFNQFANHSGCPPRDLACLRRADSATLVAANDQLVKSPPIGAFGPGPAPDGQFVRQVPALELASGNYWKGIQSIIISHVSNEPTLFVDGETDTDEKWNELVEWIIVPYAKDLLPIVQKYFPSPSTPGSPYKTETDRTKAWLDASNFLCNYRYITQAFGAQKVWNMQYSVPPGLHASDLVATFFTQGFNYTLFNSTGTIPFTPAAGSLYEAYTSYLTSLTITGDPNTRSLKVNVPPAIYWPHPTGVNDEMLGNVLRVGQLGFSLIQDTESTNSMCQFFLNVQAALTSEGGYSPPGSYVPNNLNVSNNGDPSRNYNTPAS